jgi:uncharacterized protein YkwD
LNRFVCRRILPILVLLAAGAACNDKSAFIPAVTQYNEEPSTFFKSASEKIITAQFVELCKSLGTTVPMEDNALDAAARNLAMTVKKEDVKLINNMDNDFIRSILSDMGITDNSFRVLLINVFRAEDVQAKLNENLYKDLEGERYTHFGVGAVRLLWPPTIVATIFLVRKTIVMNPFPRSVMPGEELILQGRVTAEGEDLKLIIQNDVGTIDRDLPLMLNNMFSQRILLDRPGKHTFELTLDTDRGPDVAALFTVNVEGTKGEAAPPILERVEVNSIAEARDRLLHLINAERAKRKLIAVTMDEKLNTVAQAYAREMMETGEIAHVSIKTGDCLDRAVAAGLKVKRITENIAANQTLEQVHESLMLSPAHSENILDTQVTWAGLGVAFTKEKNQVFVVENFAEYR